MEKRYNDELMPNNFEEIAKAYSQTLKDKGFVFIRLQEEEFHLLIDEILVVISKMKSCLTRLNNRLDAGDLASLLEQAEKRLCSTFGNKKPHKFNCVESESNAFLCLISLENLLILKLMILSTKSEELELCSELITNITTLFSQSIPNEFFILA